MLSHICLKYSSKNPYSNSYSPRNFCPNSVGGKKPYFPVKAMETKSWGEKEHTQ